MKKTDDNELEIEQTRFIIRINFTHSKMYVFNANGILCRRIPFHSITEVHGEPVSTSNDGRYIVLKVPIASIKQTLRYLNRDVNGKESRDAIRQALRLSVFEVTPFGLLEIKQIDIWDGIKKFFDNNT